jgi:hypothetical protein
LAVASVKGVPFFYDRNNAGVRTLEQGASRNPRRARFPPNICALSKRKGMGYLHYATQRANCPAEKTSNESKAD